ncbi:hypothetical protein K6T82_00620 [Flavobacterium sp. 17A]|uniref:CBM-cenC domain-containing protein n=1 Tax=Flavobacterium potami TaxID=2872310 RepID=A0A9X1H6V2_9FLAO|nr:carbohydrate binding domain-containing protein [Flavobacterium potami]MBZ4033252.1 hypothetical protein [Flavobacterium potami]
MKQLLLFSFLLLATFSNAQMNLIKNAGFERDLINWSGQENAALSPYEKKTGRNSVVINQFTGAEWKALDQTILIPKNSYAIECSAWMKTDQVENQKEEYKAAAIIVEFTNAADKQVGSETIGRAKNTTDWTNYKKAVKIPADAKKIRIMLALAQTNGTVFFDDINLKALGEEEYAKVDSQNK